MQLPIIVRFNRTPLLSFAYPKGKRLEFQLWDSVLSFSCPKASISIAPSAEPIFFVDERPFINTHSRTKLSGVHDHFNLINCFRTGWDIKPNPFTRKNMGFLQFNFQLYYLTDRGYPVYSDIREKKHLASWINDALHQHYLSNMINLKPTDNGEFFDISTPTSDKLLTKKEKVHLNRITNPNGLTLFEANPLYNTFDYYWSFSERDFAKFSFEVGFPTNNNAIKLVRAKCQRIIKAIINSLSFRVGIKAI